MTLLALAFYAALWRFFGFWVMAGTAVALFTLYILFEVVLE